MLPMGDPVSLDVRYTPVYLQDWRHDKNPATSKRNLTCKYANLQDELCPPLKSTDCG